MHFKFDKLGLLKNVEHQFVFIITDTDSDDNEKVKQHLALGTHPALGIEIFYQIGIKINLENHVTAGLWPVRAASDGVNLALISNASAAPAGGCAHGLRCVLAELGEALVRGWDWALQRELPLLQQVSRTTAGHGPNEMEVFFIVLSSHRKR